MVSRQKFGGQAWNWIFILQIVNKIMKNRNNDSALTILNVSTCRMPPLRSCVTTPCMSLFPWKVVNPLNPRTKTPPLIVIKWSFNGLIIDWGQVLPIYFWKFLSNRRWCPFYRVPHKPKENVDDTEGTTIFDCWTICSNVCSLFHIDRLLARGVKSTSLVRVPRGGLPSSFFSVSRPSFFSFLFLYFAEVFGWAVPPHFP